MRTSVFVPVLTCAYASRFSSKNLRSLSAAVRLEPCPSAVVDVELRGGSPPRTSSVFETQSAPPRERLASVPRSMRSSLVSTPMVRSRFGSTSFATRTPSEVAMSALAGLTATMTTFGGAMKALAISSMSRTMDTG